MELDLKRRMLLSVVESEFFSNEEDFFLEKTVLKKCKNRSKFLLNIKERARHVRPSLYAELWVTRYTEVNFYRLFRMVPETFELLLHVVEPNYKPKMRTGDGQTVDPRKALLMCIFYIAHKDSYIEISDRFNVAESTAIYEVEYILHILVGLRSQYIVWPREADCYALARQFEERAGFPGVIGAVDGSHIPIAPPTDQQLSYLNRKHSHSIVLQGICTASKLFIDVCVGVPGRRHDSSVLHMSQLYKDCRTHGARTRFFNQFHLLGDSAYPCLSWLLPTFKRPRNGQLDASQVRYNYHHSATRTIIENTFALLKGRWPRLKYVYVKDIGKVSDIVAAACVLHNFCLINHDDGWDDLHIEANVERVGAQVIDADYDEAEGLEGNAKRENIKNMF